MNASNLPHAIELARSGHKQEARLLLEEILGADPNNETAWIWLADTAGTPQERIEILENCLAVNPQAKLARGGLDALRKRYPAPPPPRPVEPEPFEPPVKPFAWEESRETPFSADSVAAVEAGEGIVEETHAAGTAWVYGQAEEASAVAAGQGEETLDELAPEIPAPAETLDLGDTWAQTGETTEIVEEGETMAAEGEGVFSALAEDDDDLSKLWPLAGEEAAQPHSDSAGTLEDVSMWQTAGDGGSTDASAGITADMWQAAEETAGETGDAVQEVAAEADAVDAEAWWQTPAAEETKDAAVTTGWETADTAVTGAEQAADKAAQPAADFSFLDDFQDENLAAAPAEPVSPFRMDSDGTGEWQAEQPAQALAGDDDFLASLLAEAPDEAVNSEDAIVIDANAVAADSAASDAVAAAQAVAEPVAVNAVRSDAGPVVEPALEQRAQAKEEAARARLEQRRAEATKKKGGNTMLFIMLLIVGVLGITVLVLGLLIARQLGF